MRSEIRTVHLCTRIFVPHLAAMVLADHGNVLEASAFTPNAERILLPRAAAPKKLHALQLVVSLDDLAPEVVLIVIEHAAMSDPRFVQLAAVSNGWRTQVRAVTAQLIKANVCWWMGSRPGFFPTITTEESMPIDMRHDGRHNSAGIRLACFGWTRSGFH